MKISSRDVAEIGIMSAVLSAGKFVLSFLPNIEIVTLLLILYAIYFGKKSIISVFIFIAIECMIWGFGLWVTMYLYIWPLLICIALIFKEMRSPFFWALFAGIFGLIYGGLCSLVYFVLSGASTGTAWWIAGIPFDIIHGVSNFIITLILFNPLSTIIKRI